MTRHSRKVILQAVVILAGAVLVALFLIFYPQLKEFFAVTTPAPSPKLEVTSVESGKLPPHLPDDIILDKNARVLRGNYTQPFMFSQGGGTIYQVQSTLVFATTKSAAEIFSLYENYLKNGKWEGITPLDNNDVKRLTAFKSSDKITLTFSKNSLTGETTVDIFNIHIGPWREIRTSPSPSSSPSPSPQR